MGKKAGIFNNLKKRVGKSGENDIEIYNAMYILCREENDDLESRRLCGLLKGMLAKSVLKSKGGEQDRLEGIFKELLLLEARRGNFDSFMQYMELKREPDKMFWLPRRKILLPVANAIQRLIDGDIDILTVSLPPGTGKTTLEIFLHAMMIGVNPDKPSLASGHSAMMTNSIYEGVLSLVQDKEEYLWEEIFPEHSKIITNAKEQTIDIGKKKRFSSLTCRAIGASLTGATRCEQLLTADDLVSGIEEAVSITRLDKLWQGYTNDLKSRKKLGCKELHLATRWSVHDPIGRLSAMYSDDDRFLSLVIPAFDENGNSNFEYEYGVGFNTEYFEDMANNLDDASFKALFMNEPIEREGLLYNEEQLNRYFEMPDGEPDAIVAVCDTKDRGIDYCVLPVAYVFGNRYYIEDVICDNSLPEIIEPRLSDILLKHNVQTARFESNAAGGRVARDIQADIRSKGGFCSITTKYSTQNKETKIIVNSGWVQEHCYFKDMSLYTKKSDYGRFMSQLCSYSHQGKNKHDDAPDGMAMLAEYAQSLGSAKAEIFQRPF